MKIRTKIALRYAGVTTILLLVFAAIQFFLAAIDREKEFYDDLKKEGISKANLFFRAKASPEIMHTIYKNNIKYIDEVEVAIYDSEFNLLYHDARDIDIVKETPEFLQQVLEAKQMSTFYVDKYQAVGFIFNFDQKHYIVTAAAFDGYGYSKLKRYIPNLLLLCLASVVVLFIIGELLAKDALKPVSDITTRMKEISGQSLALRLKIENEKDELGILTAAFNDALDKIEESFNAQKMFVSNVSHELRTPLAALIGEIDIALMKYRSVWEYEEVLMNLRQDVNRLRKLTDGLLDLAKASYDEANISLQPVRVDEALLDAREIVLKGNKDYKVNLFFDQEIEDESFISITGNEYLLKMAFANLMENNCKFSENHHSSVHISSGKEGLIIQFADTGTGIPENELAFIFTPFFRGVNKTYATGYGIGLALVKKVILLHKGEISVNSRLKEGTVFHLRFPKL